ncbi:hypothetical protein PG984_002584 [Apiospora sp. TS-2023a]
MIHAKPVPVSLGGSLDLSIDALSQAMINAVQANNERIGGQQSYKASTGRWAGTAGFSRKASSPAAWPLLWDHLVLEAAADADADAMVAVMMAMLHPTRLLLLRLEVTFPRRKKF